MKPIDADKLTQDILSLTVLYDNDYYKGRADERNDILQRIQDTPTICTDRCGKWIYRKHLPPFCSECLEDALIDNRGDYADTDFCPNCGSKMQGAF
jgi:hypothetical protein